MLYFLFGLVTGGTLGVVFMCLLQMSRRPHSGAAESAFEDTRREKTASAGVDNSAKKA